MDSTASEIIRRVDVAAPEAGLEREWLLTNGLGGFAFGTALGANTRRYHGWLVAARTPPVDRVVALHSIIDELMLPDETIELATHQFGDGMMRHPSGWRCLQSFRVESAQRVAWRYAVHGITITRVLELTPGANEASITYEVVGAPAGARLRLRPLVPLRDFHELDHESDWREIYRIAADHDGVFVTRGDRGVRLASDTGAWNADGQWWRDFAYSEEQTRGQEWREDVFAPGLFLIDLEAGRSRVTVTASVRVSTPPGSAPCPPQSPLAAAASQFVVRRGETTSIIAGYPWFADWGRDAMISLPGLLLTTGRFAEARSVLTTFATHAADGLLPNRFDDRAGSPCYNTADGGLWYIHALRAYALRSGDHDLGPLLEVARGIVRAYRQGTRFGIAVGGDGLVMAGDGNEPVTWMDAKRDGIAFTPRDGKPVELSALWHNALHCLAELVEPVDPAEAAELRERAGHTALSMQMLFWWPERECLHDVLRLGEHDWEGDARLRPNQIFAVSLPFSPLPREMQASVVEAVRDRLLTPYGLRTLDAADPGYRGRFEGDLTSRDAAYHNGTVWPWLIGAYCDARLRLGGDATEVRALLRPLIDELERGCLGQIAEVYDGDAPHRASGCPAQAWSVAEVLRVSANE